VRTLAVGDVAHAVPLQEIVVRVVSHLPGRVTVGDVNAHPLHFLVEFVHAVADRTSEEVHAARKCLKKRCEKKTKKQLDSDRPFDDDWTACKILHEASS